MKHSVIALAGPPCSGKSSTGTILASLLSAVFAETDLEVEKEEGRSVGWIFQHLGETAFRSAEKAAVERLLSGEDNSTLVLSLGGGTLLNGETRNLVESRCRLFTLWAPVKVLLSRNSGGRPLAASEDQFRTLLLSRRNHYESLPGRVNTEGCTPGEVAEKLAEILRKECPARWSL